MSNLKHYIGYGVALILLGLFIRFYVEEREGRIRAEGQQAIVEARDTAQKETSAKYEALIANLKTPQQAAPVIDRIFLPAPGQKTDLKPPVSVERGQLAPEVQKTLPDAPEGKADDPVMLLDPEEQVVLAKSQLSCEKSEGELTTCAADKLNLMNEINDLKGGTKWQKVVKEAKCLGFLGAGAGLGAKLAGWKGAVVGGVGSESVCKIFF